MFVLQIQHNRRLRNLLPSTIHPSLRFFLLDDLSVCKRWRNRSFTYRLLLNNFCRDICLHNAQEDWQWTQACSSQTYKQRNLVRRLRQRRQAHFYIHDAELR